jgi:GNAT superfamily N-acetyltransferase
MARSLPSDQDKRQCERGPYLQKKFARSVAQLHAQGITTGFLPTLGERFLATLYTAIAHCPHSTVIVAHNDDGQPSGFVAGTIDTKAMYQWIVRRYWLVLGLAALPKMVRVSAIKKALETLRYGKKKRAVKETRDAKDDKQAELLSIAVGESGRGKGVGRELVGKLERWLAAKAALESGQSLAYKVVTAADDPVSNAFYKKCGFVVKKDFLHHGNAMREYVKEIRNG